jgi:hypothetical protein
MFQGILLLFAFSLIVSQSNGLVFRNVYPLRNAFANQTNDDSNSIDSNILNERDQPVGSIRVKKVTLSPLTDVQSDNFTSYTMYVTTNRTCNSNLFGWFFQNQVSRRQ